MGLYFIFIIVMSFFHFVGFYIFLAGTEPEEIRKMMAAVNPIAHGRPVRVLPVRRITHVIQFTFSTLECK